MDCYSSLEKVVITAACKLKKREESELIAFEQQQPVLPFAQQHSYHRTIVWVGGGS